MSALAVQARPRHRRQRRHRPARSPSGSARDGLHVIVHANSGLARRRRGRRARSSPPAARPRRSPSTSPIAPPRSAACERAARRRAGPDPRQQRRHPRRRGRSRACARRNGSACIDVSLNGFFNVTQPLVMPMIAHALGPHRQHLVGRGARRQPRPGQLRRRQGRAATARPSRSRSSSRAAASPSTRSRRASSHAGMARAALRPRDDRADGADEARRHGRARSPRWSPSSPRTRPPTSAARSSRSTARCTETRRATHGPHAHRRARRRHPRRRPRRPDARAAAAAALRRPRRRWCSSAARIRCRRRRTRSASRRSRSARTTSTRARARASTSRRDAAEQVRLPLLLLAKAARSSTHVTELGASRFLADAELPARPRHLREFPRRGSARALGVRFVDGATVRGIDARRDDGARASRALRRTRRRRARRARALARRRQRPRRPAQAQARSRRSQRPRRQRGLVPHRRAHRRRRVVRRRGLARALRRRRSAGSRPTTWCGDGLLGLADPARLGLAFGRHRRRREAASARDDEHASSKAMDWLREHQPRVCAALDGKRAPAAGLRRSCATSRTAASRCSPARALGADRRGRPVPRSVLFARQRLHRDRATPTSPS